MTEEMMFDVKILTVFSFFIVFQHLQLVLP